MAISESDLAYLYSVKTGAAGYTVTSTGANSLGKYCANNALVSGTLHTLWDAVSGADASGGDTEYRCIFIHNRHASLILQSPYLWLESTVAGGATAAIGLSTSGVSSSGRANPQAEEVGTENDAPTGPTFSTPTSKAGGLALPNLGPGQVHGIWIRRTVPSSTAAMSNDGYTIRVEGDTEA